MFKFASNKDKTDNKERLDRIRKEMRDLSLLNINKLLTKLETSSRGLNVKKIEEIRDVHGKNIVETEKPPTRLGILWISFKTPFNFILGAIMVISYLTGDMKATIVMFAMVLLSSLLRFWQESKAVIEAAALKNMVTNKATVIRQQYEGTHLVSKQFDIPMEELVPGDIVHLSAGDMIPGDVRLIFSKDLFVSQSALTGEALPVEKHETFKKLQRSVSVKNLTESISVKDSGRLSQDFISLDQPNICFMGSSIVSGTAVAVVLSTGNNTFFGTMASQLLGKRPATSFDKGVDKISMLLVKFMLVMAPAVFLINGILKGDWTDSFLFAISIAVGLTPEMLPMILNSNLAKGAMAMAKRKTIVKRLNAIQSFGAIDVLCTDKTGTLTQDKVVLIKHLDAHGEKSTRVLEQAYLNSHFQTGLKNLLDKAVISRAEEKGVDSILNKYKLIDEIPFDFIRKRMTVILERSEDKSRIFYSKGAVEETLEICSFIDWGDGSPVPFTEDVKKSIIDLKDNLSDDGLRVVAVAYKPVSGATKEFSVQDESGLIFSGYIAFLDPPKATTAEALTLLRRDGIDVKILTGDNALVARKICKEVGLPVDNIAVGSEIDLMSEDELIEVTRNTTIFAKLSPLNKSRIVKNLKSQGHVVGFLGDGINDALALREADVGISVDTGTDLAKEAADIILLEKSLLVLSEAVREGRLTFGNILKYIKMTCASNFGNVFSVLVASAVLPFLPMLPVQLLIQNLLYDVSQTSIPWDKMDEDYLRMPRNWESDSMARFMIIMGPISSIFDIITFAVLWFIFKANCDQAQALFHSGWFVEGLLTQTLIVHMIRTEKIPFIQSTASFTVIMMTALVMIIGLLLPFSSFVANSIGFVPLPIGYFPWLAGIVVSYCILTQICKGWYIRKFHSWM